MPWLTLPACGRAARPHRERSPALHWTSSSRTDVGKVRQHNEDACLDLPEAGLWAVADGMGGHSAGDLASGMIVERLAAVDAGVALGAAVEHAERILEEVNRDLRALAATRDAQTIGSTVAALLTRDDYAVCLWAGDSRVYRVRGDTLDQVTQDHALVAELVDRGVLTAEQAANHPQGNLVTRAVGAGETLKLDLEIMRVEPGDLFILCSDGLDKEVSAEEIHELSRSCDGCEVARALVDLALSRGSRDNVTVVAVQAHAEPPRDDADSEDTLPGFITGRGSA